MKVLWITNILLPDICDKIGVTAPVTGGWMASSLNAIKGNGISFGVASLYNGGEFKDFLINDVHYFLIPAPKDNNKYNVSLEKYWKEVNEKFKPDLVHLHGTEFAHGLSFINSCPKVKVIASIQGLVSVIHRYFFAGLSTKDILFNISFRDLIRGTIFLDKKKIAKRSDNEMKIIKSIDYVIGRTDWDKSNCLAINNKIKYCFCNETLRSSFFGKEWNYNECEKQSIFISQASYPIKGLHQVLKSLPLILNKYKDLKVYIGGPNITKNDTLVGKIKMSGYGKYIKNLIKRNNLESNIIFLGSLNEEEMVKRYLKSNIFICPSSIENSPNSLGEAQILGVPCISSYVGGVPNMVEDGITGFLYRFEEVEMLAMLIDKVFSMQEEKLKTLSTNQRQVALIRHNPSTNHGVFGDWIWGFENLLASDKFIFVNEVTAVYRLQVGVTNKIKSREQHENKLSAINDIKNKYENLFGFWDKMYIKFVIAKAKFDIQNNPLNYLKLIFQLLLNISNFSPNNSFLKNLYYTILSLRKIKLDTNN